jgi:hypothetical protein
MPAKITPPPSRARRDDGRRYSVFVASPSDVERYRKSAKEVFDQINQVLSPPNKFSVFMWEDHMTADFADNIQKDIFRDARDKWNRECGYDQCEILVLIFWSKLGEGTPKEYHQFVRGFKKHQPERARLLACVIGKPISGDAAETRAKLNAFLKSNQKNWKEIGGVRCSIKTKGQYQIALRYELEMFLNRPSL